MHGKGLSPSDASRPRSGGPESFLGSEILAERGDCQIQINEWCVKASTVPHACDLLHLFTLVCFQLSATKSVVHVREYYYDIL